MHQPHPLNILISLVGITIRDHFHDPVVEITSELSRHLSKFRESFFFFFTIINFEIYHERIVQLTFFTI